LIVDWKNIDHEKSIIRKFDLLATFALLIFIAYINLSSC